MLVALERFCGLQILDEGLSSGGNPGGGLESAGREAEAGFEDAGEVGELFKAEFEGDFLDSITGEEAFVGAVQAEDIEPFTDGHVVV